MSAAVEVYTDGCCAPTNPGPGGYAAVILSSESSDGSWVVCGGEPDTTNNRMELRAAIEALRALPAEGSVRIFSDSRYVIDGFTKWLPGWKGRGWTTSDKGEVKNRDLWEALDLAVVRHLEVTWFWVKGHSITQWNERADGIAGEEARKQAAVVV